MTVKRRIHHTPRRERFDPGERPQPRNADNVKKPKGARANRRKSGLAIFSAIARAHDKRARKAAKRLREATA